MKTGFRQLRAPNPDWGGRKNAQKVAMEITPELNLEEATAMSQRMNGVKCITGVVLACAKAFLRLFC